MHQVYVLKRPGVDTFMKRVGEIFEVVVFTASLAKVPTLDPQNCPTTSKPRRRRRVTDNVVGSVASAQYADPVLDLLDIHRVTRTRLFRESCVQHKGNFVKVRPSPGLLSSLLCRLTL